jgi:hypothetical protein
VQKATAINGRQSATSLMPKKIRHWATEGRKSKGSLNEGRIFRLNWIEIGSLESAVFNRLFSQNKKYNEAAGKYGYSQFYTRYMH